MYLLVHDFMRIHPQKWIETYRICLCSKCDLQGSPQTLRTNIYKYSKYISVFRYFNNFFFRSEILSITIPQTQIFKKYLLFE